MKTFLATMIVLCPLIASAQWWDDRYRDSRSPQNSEDAAVFFNYGQPPPVMMPDYSMPDTSGWGENNWYEQERRNRQSDFYRQQEQSWGNYGVPGSDRPIACGPYYDPSMRPGC